MDGTTTGAIIVDLILAYWVTKSAWNKTKSTGKTIIVLIVALISPIIAWIVEACMKKAPEEVTENNVVDVKPVIIDNATKEVKEDNINNISDVHESKLSENTNDVDKYENISNVSENVEETKQEDVSFDHEENTTIDKIKDNNVMQSKILFCKKCGSKLDEGFKFCKKCGAKIDG